MVAISELPDAWRGAVLRWRTLNRRAKQTVNEAEAPDANEEYLFYQTLLGTWPVDETGAPLKSATPEYIGRIQAYMAKALKEAKINTSWIQPNEPWDNAMREFVAKTLEPSDRNRFLPAFLPLAEEIARLGAINSLAQLVLKLTVPGVPDIYQGNEVWDFSLVDPDNRRRVDYEKRRQMLESLEKVAPAELLQSWPNGRIKLFVTTRLLRLRRDEPRLFGSGDYVPLVTSGAFAESCVAFARERGDRSIVVVVPRLSSRVGFPPVGDKWQDTVVQLPDQLGNARELFTGGDLRVDEGKLPLRDALAVLPFAVYLTPLSGSRG
jgi:(1->4)-alpha-D-glucan 1-alpha-D-glucosylmutase